MVRVCSLMKLRYNALYKLTDRFKCI